MKCDFCKRDETEIMGLFVPIIDSFKKEIKDIDLQIKGGLEDQYRSKHGFTQENFDKLQRINANILEMKIDAFINNLTQFINLEPNLQMLNEYFTKYESKISLSNTIGELVDLFINEPIEIRLRNELQTISSQKSILEKKIKTIEDQNKFYEHDIDEIEIPLNVFNFEDNFKNEIKEISKIDKITVPRKMMLCPYCKDLFVESPEISKIKMAVMERARQKKMRELKERYKDIPENPGLDNY
jgi:hypothetical protein